ncbi:hypothetical protein L6452_20925 [Arctium lappa]|uniref:Uncharacterized protein n=1 Tax=Arctium lappa TaxID=4217 RepID=A0ACB9BEL8_ARCLA|nr:hypothetical protein L6452_20925 [Arctium lappa]
MVLELRMYAKLMRWWEVAKPPVANQSPPSTRLLPPSSVNITTTPAALAQSISTVYSPSSSISREHHHHSSRLQAMDLHRPFQQALLSIRFVSYSLLPSVSCGCGNRYSDGVPDADFDTGDDRGRFPYDYSGVTRSIEGIWARRSMSSFENLGIEVYRSD